MKIKNKIIGGILIILVFAGVYFVFTDGQKDAGGKTDDSTIAQKEDRQPMPEEQKLGNPEPDNLHYDSDFGFSFDYPRDMFIMVDPETKSRLFAIPNSYRANEGEKLTAIVISVVLNEPPMTPLEWLNGPNSGADMSKGYLKLDIDGQEAISMNGNAWITVNTPDNKLQLSIATLPSVSPSQQLLTEMNAIVTSLVFSR